MKTQAAAGIAGRFFHLARRFSKCYVPKKIKSVQENPATVKTEFPPAIIKRYYRINRKDIAVVQFIIEGYEGMATLTTLDPKQACLQMAVIEDHWDDFALLMEDMKKSFDIRELERP